MASVIFNRNFVRFNFLKKLLGLLQYQERKKATWLLFFNVLAAILELVSISSIFPLISSVFDSESLKASEIWAVMIFTWPKLQNFSDGELAIIFAIVVFVFLLMAIMAKAFATFYQIKFVHEVELSLSTKLMAIYLSQPYEWFLNRHGADIGKALLSEIQSITTFAFQPLFIISLQLSTLVAIVSLLFYFDPILTLIISAVIGLVYATIYLFSKKYISSIGQERLTSNKQRFKAVTEAFSGVKEVKIDALEKFHLKRYFDPASKYITNQASVLMLGQLPRYALEVVVFGGMLLMLLYLASKGESGGSVLPAMTLYAYAGYKIMPAMQQIFSAIAQLKFIGPALDNVHRDLCILRKPYTGTESGSCIEFNSELKLKNLSYKYPNSSRFALDKVNIKIPSGALVGLAGESGSGKTTAVDIILGLLDAQTGVIEVDGCEITPENKSSWQKLIGYVPQNIFLTDTSIKENIAIGVEPEKINEDRLIEAAKIANIHDFILSELSDGYATEIGERGIRISGGQRQRIGIARAIYKQPKILVLDEATSALDQTTEAKVIKSITNLGNNITVIMIAHRLSTLAGCEKIFLFNKGCISDVGTFESLIQTSSDFKQMTLSSKF